MEINAQILSDEIIKEMPGFNSQLIYWTLGVFLITLLGLVFLVFLGYKAIKKNLITKYQ